MPDRQRHGRLSDAFARLFAARFQKSPASADQHQVAAPAAEQRGVAESRSLGDGHRIEVRLHEPVSRDAGSGDENPAAETGEPLWSDDPRAAETMELSRSAWELSALHRREADRPDPMADTMQLSRLDLSQPTTKPADPDSGRDTGSDTDTDADADHDPDPKPLWSWPWSWSAVQPLLLKHRRRLAMGAAGVVAVGALLALPPVRAELRDSFTRLPQPYTALYFTTPPQVDGTVLTVPVSVHAVDTSADSFTVRVWTVDAQGHVDDSQNADLTWDGEAMSAVVSMPVNPQADYVWVSLNGSSETLHYKIAVA